MWFNPLTGIPFYIGKGCGVRMFDHTRPSAKGLCATHIRNLLKHGIIASVKIICDEVDEEFAFLVEELAIEKYGRKHLSTGPLLNLTAGGDGASPTIEVRRTISLKLTGVKKSSEIKRNMSIAQKKVDRSGPLSPVVRAKISKTLSGTIKSEKTKQKMSDGQRARHARNKTKG